jgi:hypothetical protein
VPYAAGAFHDDIWRVSMAAMCDGLAGKTRVAFLVGAGASQAAGALGTDAITKRVLAVPPQTSSSERAAVLFMRVLDSQVRLFYENTAQTERTPNYEDLYYIAGQVLDAVTADHDVSGVDNPAVDCLVERLLDNLDVKAAMGKIGVASDRSGIGSVARLAMSLTEHVLLDSLRETESKLEEPSAVSTAFQMFVDATLEDNLAVDVFTLNNDLIMETVLLSAPSLGNSAEGRSFVDGFSVGEDGLRWWNPGAFDDPLARVRLFKLHGSLNWWLSSTSSGPPWPPLFMPGLAARANRPVLPSNYGSALGPVLLVGRSNKAVKQTHGVFLDLLARFQEGLRRTDTLVVVGYGFGDTPISVLVLEWLASEGRKAVVIGKDSEDFLRHARQPVGNALAGLRSLGRVEFVDGGLQPDSWSVVRECLGG